MTELPNEDIISSLTGTALRVFVYAVKKGKDIGVRETQRDLGLKTASHAQYHLQRLEQISLLDRNDNNKYSLPKEYESLRSLKIGILTEIYVFKGWIIPSLGIFAGFLGASIIISLLFFFLLSNPLISVIFSSTSLLLTAIYSSIRTIQIVKSFKKSED
ncbi:MAG: hypothetical protein KGD64_05040 [Candidatus Heimdallarchaeota archaeon]|nr:hypothetical protein [Candidatus Heimdallarchaeota archaeon]